MEGAHTSPAAPGATESEESLAPNGGGGGAAESAMQALHFAFAAGAVLSPLGLQYATTRHREQLDASQSNGAFNGTDGVASTLADAQSFGPQTPHGFSDAGLGRVNGAISGSVLFTLGEVGSNLFSIGASTGVTRSDIIEGSAIGLPFYAPVFFAMGAAGLLVALLIVCSPSPDRPFERNARRSGGTTSMENKSHDDTEALAGSHGSGGNGSNRGVDSRSLEAGNGLGAK